MKVLRKNINLHIGLFAFLCIFNSMISCELVHLKNTSSLRLPTSIQPTKYNLHIKSNIHEDILDFSGNVLIEFVVKESTNEIVIHAKQLRDFVISLKEVRNRRRFENLKYSTEVEKDFLRILAPKTLYTGERYVLEINYIGKIQKELVGFYKTTYLDEFYNKSIPLAITRFEPAYARLAFPCFDEPSFRATFVITITHGIYYLALSNMPIDGQPSFKNNLLSTTFRETPTMPTYLVGFVICNFRYISEYVNGIEHRVFYPPNANDTGTRAMTNSIQSLAFLEKHLGIDYPLPKLDHIHVKDTDMVAMNWGLAIYDDTEFLTTLEDRESTVKRMVMQNYIMSQQWFSNMVAPKWWSVLWVNSALGTYFSYKITDMMFPQWKIEEFFILTEIDELLKLNDMKIPLHRSIETEASLEMLVSDDTLCQMGAGILKMFNHAIGNETFTKGLHHYLKKFKNSIADEDDFFRAIQSAISDDYLYVFQIDKSLPEIMKTWTNNKGIPTVRATRHYNNGTITIQQRPYNGNSTDKWWIPLNFATASNGNFARTTTDYIMPPLVRVSIDLEELNVSLMNRDWLILNKQQTGLYYVIYDDHNLELIAKALNEDHTSIHMLNRALLFRDFKAILDTELGAIEPLLESLKYLKNEQDSLPWYEASVLINELWLRLENGKAFELFRTFINDIIENFYHKLFELPLYKLSFADSIVKKTIYKLACEVELSECFDHAIHQTKEYFYYNWLIEEDSKSFTICKAMQAISPEELKEILEKMQYPSVTSPAKERDLLKSLHCLTSAENINLIFDFVHEGERTRLKQSISDYMLFYHLSFREKITNVRKARPQRDLNEYRLRLEEIDRKRGEFKKKYEESIYKWLKDYELKQRF